MSKLIQEYLPASRYIRTEEVISEIDPSYRYTTSVGYNCPNCGSNLAGIMNVKTVVCDCGMIVERENQWLYCKIYEAKLIKKT